MTAAKDAFGTSIGKEPIGLYRSSEVRGIAPATAANRNEALPAIFTRQIDGGLRFAMTEVLRLVAGGFDVFYTRSPLATWAACPQYVVVTRRSMLRGGAMVSWSGEMSV